jgi:hypothetical protein
MRMRAAGRGLLAAAIALVACLAVSGTAMADQDPLSGGTAQIKLQKLRGLKLTASLLNLKITGGQVDPISGAGNVKVAGPVGARRGQNKSSFTITALNLGANGGPGNIVAKVGRKKVSGFGTLSGGTVTRDRWGARIEGVSAKLGRNGAKALTRVLLPDGGGGIKSGQPLGTINITTLPQTVEVVPGSGTMTLTTPLTFALKLDSHCIDALSGGVAPVAPATQSLTSFTFPVSGGSLSPTFVDGKIQTSGGQTVTKNNGGLVPILYPSCGTADPPVGTSILQNDFAADFGIKSLTAHAFPPGVDLGVAALATFDTQGALMTVDPVTKQVTISNLGVDLSPIAGDLLNNLFPNQSGNPANDFSQSDRLGSLDITAKLR